MTPVEAAKDLPVAPDRARPEDEALVRRLMTVIAGRAPLREAERILAPDVLCHMDRFSTRGTETWGQWVTFIRSRGVDDLEPLIDRVTANADGTVTAHGRFRGRRGGRAVEGAEGGATYRISGGRIVEIWTRRQNYELIFGRRALHPLRWLLVLAHMSLWSRLPGRSRPGPADGAAPLPQPQERAS